MQILPLHIWIALPILIFTARVIDVSLGTLRIIFTARGHRYLAPLLGFIEVFIWIVVVSQITSRANNLISYLAYAAGFAAGNYVGLWIESRLAMGTLVVRAILAQGGAQVAAMLHEANYGVTTVAGQGANGPVQLIYTVIQRKNLNEVLSMIHNANPKAFLTIEEVRSAQAGIFPQPDRSRRIAIGQRKGK
jgi:uncharacterized protein YebE (UPF0316 family)